MHLQLPLGLGKAVQKHLSRLGSRVTIIMGATFVVYVLLFRRGIVGEIEYRRLKKS